MKHDDGGPVHPKQFDDVHHDGMTLWDYYAAAAMQGLLANPVDSADRPMTGTEIIRASCDYADAMIAERKKRGIGQ